MPRLPASSRGVLSAALGQVGPLPPSMKERAENTRKQHEGEGWEVKIWNNELWERYKDDPFVQALRTASPACAILRERPHDGTSQRSNPMHSTLS